MFGMGFTEILIIAVIAILFLGPDKLPSAMVDIAKFFRNAKNAIGSVKDTLEEEVHFSEMKKEALAYKDELTKATDIKGHVGAQFDTLTSAIEDDDIDEVKSKEPQEVTLKKKKKKKTTDEEEMKNV